MARLSSLITRIMALVSLPAVGACGDVSQVDKVAKEPANIVVPSELLSGGGKLLKDLRDAGLAKEASSLHSSVCY